MAVNRYTEYNPQQYVSTYVPLPLEMMYQGLATKQKKFDDTIDETYKLQDLMAKVNAIDKHKQYKKQLEDKYYPKIEEIADEITKTGDLTRARDIKRIAREWEHDPLRQELETSYANYQAYAADKIKKGDKYGEWYDNYIPFQGSDESGNITGYRYTGMGEVQDHQKLAMDMMDKVKEDGWKADDAVLGDDGIIRSKSGGSEHILSSKIRNLARDKADSFLVTREGRDFATMLSYYNPNVDLRKAAEDYLYEAGANQIFSKSERGNDIDVTSMWKTKYDEQKEAFEMGLQYVGADPSTSQNDSNLTRITQSVTGSDNFEFRDGELHYNPIKEGTEYINVFGKNYDAKKAKADGAIEINGVKFAVTSGANGQLNVMLPKGNGWEGVNYTIKTAGKNQGLLEDAKKIDAVAKRLGYTGGDMKGNQKALESYMMDVYNIESTSTAFPVGLEGWLSKEFGTNVDKDGNITNPAQLSNMTLKTADGKTFKGDSDSDILTAKANKLKGARISGFSKSLTNKDVKPGDLEITGADGVRYILSTGKQNLKDASAASHRLLQSVNDWVMEGKKDHDYSELEDNIRGILKVSKDAIHVTTQEKAADGLIYTSFVFNNGGKLEKKVLVGDSKGNLVEKDPISLSEAARRMDSAGMLKHLPFYNKDATKRQETDYSNNLTEYEESLE